MSHSDPRITTFRVPLVSWEDTSETIALTSSGLIFIYLTLSSPATVSLSSLSKTFGLLLHEVWILLSKNQSYETEHISLSIYPKTKTLLFH